MKTGVLLINLGTPEGADSHSISAYLKEFLDDPRVIQLPWMIRKVLLYGFILPFRTRRSTKAYQAIWDKAKGSPLLYHTQSLAQEVQAVLGECYHVEVGMRYAKPSIASAIEKLLNHRCEKIIVFPLFPQYSSAATGSAIEKALSLFAAKHHIPALTLHRDFYDRPEFIQAQSEQIKPLLDKIKPDAVVFSYHSLPVRHLQNGGVICANDCLQNHPCPMNEMKTLCYRAQCYQTSQMIANNLGLPVSLYHVAFQSRLGRAQWIGPDVLTTMQQLIQQKKKNLLWVCPSFVVDCLETLEEIGIQGKKTWEKYGGESFTLVPCLNSQSNWVRSLANWLRV